MNLFDKLVEQALINKEEFSGLRVVVEKELFHHDILRILSQNNFLKNLTFIGGTALRSCYGSQRLSEDLDFTGGGDFCRASLIELKYALESGISKKYDFPVTVTEPIQDKTNVSTWRIRIQTRPNHRDLPSQHIHLDISSVPSYEKKAMLLLNPYGVDMGTNGLIIQTESKPEIYVDKIIAFGLRSRLKFRDLWDIYWLHQQLITPNYALVKLKLQDHNVYPNIFKKMVKERVKFLSLNEQIELDFKKEMSRFLPKNIIQAIYQEGYWLFLTELLKDLIFKTIDAMDNN